VEVDDIPRLRPDQRFPDLRLIVDPRRELDTSPVDLSARRLRPLVPAVIPRIVPTIIRLPVVVVIVVSRAPRADRNQDERERKRERTSHEPSLQQVRPDPSSP
jgi:hypothetical protein